MTEEPVSERRASTAEFREISKCVHALDTRAAVLENRQSAQDRRLSDIETNVSNIREDVQNILDRLNQHALRDIEMQRQVLFWIVGATISTAITAIAVIGKSILLGK